MGGRGCRRTFGHYVGEARWVVILAGKSYRQYLEPIIRAWGCRIDVPMRGLGIGRQLQWLSRH